MPRTLYYTFGNHMHWVDMEWLWGYHVLPGSVRDMLRFCRETGARGCVNFDGVGYEKLAVEHPETFSQLKEAVQSGQLEPVGCSYGQPYGLFHGGESNVRQRIYGVRTVKRLFGVDPNTFWEEEFDFFPQLPQILRGVGIEFGSLFFQWTWHTPEVPEESSPGVIWQSPDESFLVAATRNKLNLHQWPEEFDPLLDELPKENENTFPPLIQQWLELMPSPDWMCRSEVLLPRMKELLDDERFDIRFTTLSEFLRDFKGGLPIRMYTMDDVWHGLTLGKNGDNMRRRSLACESMLLATESLSALMGLFGRPYAQWDVYPTWELEESWRELLQAQHHDNDECEGLCGHVGKFSYDRSLSLSSHVAEANMGLLAQRATGSAGDVVVFNAVGWVRDDTIPHPSTGVPVVIRGLPAAGYRVYAPGELEEKNECWSLEGDRASGARGGLSASVEASGVVSFEAPEIGGVRVLEIDAPGLRQSAWPMRISDPEKDLVLTASFGSGEIETYVKLPSDVRALDFTIRGRNLPRLHPGFAGSIRLRFPIPEFSPAGNAAGGGGMRLIADYPYGISEVHPKGKYCRKYPEGDWMTSPQWFEEVDRPFHASSFVDIVSPDGLTGLLIIHDGSQQWFARDGWLECVLTAYDPWDEDYFVDSFAASLRLIPHDQITNAERFRLAQNFRNPPLTIMKGTDGGGLPQVFSGPRIEPANVVLTAFHRETEDRGAWPNYVYAGEGIGHPYVLRLVELEGRTTKCSVSLPGTVAAAFKTDLLGRQVGTVRISGEDEGRRSRISLGLRAYEVATIFVDLVEGRKQPRDLDAKREIWSRIHRI